MSGNLANALILHLISIFLCLHTSQSEHPHNGSNLNSTETAFSLICFNTDVGYVEPNSFEDAANYFKVILLVGAAALQSKSGILWSESRILRKVHARFPFKLRNSVTPDMLSNPEDPDPYEVFFHLYLQLSKGRHRTYSRAYSALFYGFLYITAIVEFVYFTYGGEAIRISTSEAFIALKLPVLVNSLTVLGATNLTLFERLLLLSVLTAYGTIVMVIGLGHVQISQKAASILRIVFITGSVSVVFIEFCYYVYAYLGFSSSISDIVARMFSVQKERWIKDTKSYQERIIEKLRPKQNKRLKKLSKEAQRKAGKLKESVFSRIKRTWVEKDFDTFIAFFNFLAWNGLSLVDAFTWGQQESKYLSILVVIGMLDILATFMLFVNDSRVEEDLFKELLKIAHMPEIY